MRRKRRPKTDLDPQFNQIAEKMYLLEKENERLGKCIEIALEVLEFLWKKQKSEPSELHWKKWLD